LIKLQLIFFLLFFASCFSHEHKAEIPHSTIPADTIQFMKIAKDTIINISGVPVEILLPDSQSKGNILCFPGWNFSKNDVCKKSDFCQKAKAAGYTLILPEMGKSIYAKQNYPETRKDWQTFPTRSWILEVLLPELQKKYGFLQKKGNNFLYGISTGARGVALIALHTDHIFKGGAALSGDYDQTKFKKDNLMNGFYGSFEQFPERWTGDENPFQNAEKYKIPLFLIHGGKDAVVPVSQTELFFKELEKKNPQLGSKLKIDPIAGHDYKFWSALTSEILLFFDSFIEMKK